MARATPGEVLMVFCPSILGDHDASDAVFGVQGTIRRKDRRMERQALHGERPLVRVRPDILGGTDCFLASDRPVVDGTGNGNHDQPT